MKGGDTGLSSGLLAGQPPCAGMEESLPGLGTGTMGRFQLRT